MTAAFASNCVELFLSHHGCWSSEVNIGAEEQLVSNLQNCPRHKEGEVTCDPKVWQLVSGQVVTSYTSCDTDDCDKDNEVA